MTTLLALVNATTAGNDLGGAEVRRIRTLKKYLMVINFAQLDPNADTLALKSGWFNVWSSKRSA